MVPLDDPVGCKPSHELASRLGGKQRRAWHTPKRRRRRAVRGGAWSDAAARAGRAWGAPRQPAIGGGAPPQWQRGRGPARPTSNSCRPGLWEETARRLRRPGLWPPVWQTGERNARDAGAVRTRPTEAAGGETLTSDGDLRRGTRNRTKRGETGAAGASGRRRQPLRHKRAPES